MSQMQKVFTRESEKNRDTQLLFSTDRPPLYAYKKKQKTKTEIISIKNFIE